MVDIDRSVIEVAFGDRSGTSSSRRADPDGTARREVEGRLAVVTGAAGALGASVAAELVERGAHVCLVGRDLDSLRDTVDRLGPGAHTAMLRCDLASAEDVASAADFVTRIGEPVDLLVHAAGIHAPSTIARGEVEDLDEHYLLDVRGPYLLTQRLLPSLLEARGRVVFFSVGAAEPSEQPGGGGDVHRDISQAGLAALATALRDEVDAEGVRVLTVRTEDDLDAGGPGPDQDRFLRACAAQVLDLLAAGSLHATDLRVRRAARVGRSERR